MKLIRLGCLCLLPLLAGCRSARAPAAAVDPVVAGDTISFPADAPQLAALSTEPVGGETATNTRLFGRLAWDDNETVRVFTPFAGRVRRVLVEVGQTVTKGAALAEVESPDFAQAQAEARTAESDLRFAESNLARLRDLFEHGAAARKDVEAGEAEEARALSQRAQSRARLDAYEAGADSVSGLFLLRSPMAGTVVERTLTPGQEIRPDQMLANAPQLFSPLFVITDPTRLWIEIDATEADGGCLKPGTPFRFTASGVPGQPFAGRVELVSDEIDPTTHSVRARGSVENPHHLLKAEMFVSVDLPGRAAAATGVPSGAVFLRGDRHFVFVEDRPGAFTRREVQVSAERDSEVLVSAGVHAGDRVVTEGCLLLEQILN